MCFLKARRLVTKGLLRSYSSNVSALVSQHLVERSVLNVSGPDSQDLLQGLTTNDMNLLNDSTVSSVYTHFLNVKGRVLFDAIIFKDRNDKGLLLDCDRSQIATIIQHLKMYKLRRKVDVQLMDNLEVWSVFHGLQGIPESLSLSEVLESSSTISEDPRGIFLGHRLLIDGSSEKKLQKKLVENSLIKGDEYKKLRYSQAVPEGCLEIIPGKSLPLECNLEFLKGVSFQKGCYIGQELTARTHHTGVIRKRIMPLECDSNEVSVSQTIVNEKDASVGVVMGVGENCLIGLMRIEESTKAERLKIKDTEISVNLSFPQWWPLGDKF